MFASELRVSRILISAMKTIRSGECFRFVVAGSMAFFVDVGILVFLQEIGLKHIKNGVLVATALGFSISLVLHYFLSIRWVFAGNKVKGIYGHAVASGLFLLTNVVGLLLNELGMWIGVTLLLYHYIFVKVAVTSIVMVWNYSCQKLFIFKPEEG